MSLLLKIIDWIKLYLFRKHTRSKAEHSRRYRDIFSGPHDCSLVALMAVMPSLQVDEVKDAFMLCCKRWPHAGVNNKDFNISLRHLGIFDHFKYDDSDGQTINTCLQRKKNSSVLLIDGHFLAIHEGKIYDEYFSGRPPSNTKVYFSWELKDDSRNA